MADVETVPETTVVSKTVETKVEEDGTVVTEETTVIEVNGDHKEVKDNEVSSGDVDKPSEEKENGEVVKEVASDEATGEENAGSIEPATQEENAAPPEEPKEPPTPKVKLHQYQPSINVPSSQVFCLKVETFLRLHKIPYENIYGSKPGKNGRLPWIEYQGERVEDSNFMFDFLNEKFELNMDNELSDEQKALGQMIVNTIQDKLYFALLYQRWVVNYAELKRIQKQQQGGLGSAISLKMQQSKIIKNLDGQGMGRYTKEEVYKLAQNDLKAVSTLLGEKEFILGDQPSSFDCAVFGLLAQCIWNGVDEALAGEFLKENASNLVSYSERMKNLCWMDWSEMVLGDKPAPPNLNKRFSFRKKKKPAVAKPKEESEEKPEEKKEEENSEQVADEKPAAEEKPAEEQNTEEKESTETDKKEEDSKTESNEKSETENKIEEVQNTDASVKVTTNEE